MLPSMGIDVRARDKAGNTCLYLYFKNKLYQYDSTDRHNLVALVQAGADVRAVNDAGQTPPMVAYTYSDDWEASSSFRGGGVWDVVLWRCGYDLAEFRRDFPERPDTALYTHQDGQALGQSDVGETDETELGGETNMEYEGGSLRGLQLLDAEGPDMEGEESSSEGAEALHGLTTLGMWSQVRQRQWMASDARFWETRAVLERIINVTFSTAPLENCSSKYLRTCKPRYDFRIFLHRLSASATA